MGLAPANRVSSTCPWLWTLVLQSLRVEYLLLSSSTRSFNSGDSWSTSKDLCAYSNMYPNNLADSGNTPKIRALAVGDRWATGLAETTVDRLSVLDSEDEQECNKG